MQPWELQQLLWLSETRCWEQLVWSLALWRREGLWTQVEVAPCWEELCVNQLVQVLVPLQAPLWCCFQVRLWWAPDWCLAALCWAPLLWCLEAHL